MKCTNKNCEVISLVPRTKCPECGSPMKKIEYVDQDKYTVVDGSVNIDGTAFVVSAEIELEE